VNQNAPEEIKVNDLTFSCDLSKPTENFPHFWEHTVGSGHATLALRADYQKQLARCSRELGFKHVRFHGVLSDDMGTLMCESDELVYSFYNADQICDFLLSIGMKPFMELSFMPSTLSSGGDIVFHYKANVTPPRDYAAWATLIGKLVGHWVERYGPEETRSWFFEIWNEPNLRAFWTGSQEDYFKLYEVAAKAIKTVDPKLRVGGPATAQNAWIPEFLSYCEMKNTPVDFVSTHHYPTDAFGKPGDDTITQLSLSRRSVLRDEATKAKSEAKEKPLYYTEWSTSSNPFDELHDLPYAAAYIAKTALEARGIVEGYSYWTFSDIFEENYFDSKPFHGGFGLMNIYGIPKPAYRAYELLHRLGSELLKIEGSHPSVDVWVTREKEVLKILLVHSVLPRHPEKTEWIKIRLSGVPSVRSSSIERIDEINSNAYAAWIRMGKPDSLKPAEVDTLERASLLMREPFPVEIEGSDVFVQVSVPAQSVTCITLEI
jgi:xylan 1,4-beta-xylosidase